MTVRSLAPLPTAIVRALREGGPDVHGQPPERGLSDATAPCRHRLRDAPEGAGIPMLAHRLFPEPQSWAETGVIFLRADRRAAWRGEDASLILDVPADMLRARDARRRIGCGTGGVVGMAHIAARAAALPADPPTACDDVRTAAKGCVQRRVARA